VFMAAGVVMATATGTVSSLGVTGAAKFIAPSADDVSFGLGLLGAATAGMAACGAANVALGEAHAEVRTDLIPALETVLSDAPVLLTTQTMEKNGLSTCARGHRRADRRDGGGRRGRRDVRCCASELGDGSPRKGGLCSNGALPSVCGVRARAWRESISMLSTRPMPVE